MRRLVAFDVDEVQAYSTLALPAGLLAVLAYWHTFIALQMPFTTCKTTRAYPLWFPSTARRCVGHRRIYVVLVGAVPYCGWCGSLGAVLGHCRSLLLHMSVKISRSRKSSLVFSIDGLRRARVGDCDAITRLRVVLRR